MRKLPHWEGEWPGLLLDWRRTPEGRWQGRVAVAVDDYGQTVVLELWVDGADLRAAVTTT